MDPRFIKPKEDFNIPWLPTRMELFNILDTNHTLADFKVLVLSRILVMLRLGKFSNIPHSVQLSLKGSVSVFHTKFTQKLSKAGNSPEAFIEKEKLWLNMDIWLDKDTKKYISDPVAYISKEPQPQSKKKKKSKEAINGIEPIAEVWVLPEVNYDPNEDVRLQAGFVQNDEGEWDGLTLKKVKKKDEDAARKLKRTYIKSGRYRGRGRGGRRGRPAKPYEALSERSQRRQSYQLSKYHTVEELLGAAYHGSHKIYRHDVARNIKQIREIYSGPPLKTLPKPIPPIIAFSPNEVVNWVIDSGITKRCYQELRLTCKAKKANIFPSYNHIANAKIACYPKTIHVNQIVAEIPLQSLLNHTAERVVVLNKEEVGKMKPERGRLKLNLVFKWGYDSSSGTSEWRQRFLSDSMRDGSDADLFCVSLVPLSLRHPDGVIWHNPTPSNTRFGRPLSVQLGKEAPELAYEAQAKVEAQIQDLQPAFFVVDLDEKTPTFEDNDEDIVKETQTVANTNILIPNSISSSSYSVPSSIGSNAPNVNASIGNMLGGVPSNLGRKLGSKKSVEDKRVEVEVYFLLQHTVVEPVSNHGTFGSYIDKDSNCHVCISNPQVLSQFNVPVVTNPESHKYIVSKNQVWQNCFDTLVNLASFIPQESWAGRVDVSARMAQRKVDIHKAFKKELGLIVDKCKSGNVSNNDAMQIRKAFQSEEEFSRLTGVDRELLHRFNVILTAMSLDYEINTDEFGLYCKATADYFSQVYRWFQLPTIVHKLLYHGKAMAEEFIIPIGMMSEEAQLARNRDSKSFFQRHAKKESTEQILMQVIKHMMVLGDPVMSQADLETRKTKQNWKFYKTNKRLVFDEDVQKLLLAPTQFDERKKLMRHRNQLYKKNKIEREQKQERKDPIKIPTLEIDTSNVQDLSINSQPSTSKQTLINRTQAVDIKPGLVTYEILATPDLASHIPGNLGAREQLDLKSTVNRIVENQTQGNIISMTAYENPGITYQNNGTAKITYNFPTLLELSGQDASSRLRTPHPQLVQYAAPPTPVTTSQTTYNTVTGTFPLINFPYHQ